MRAVNMMYSRLEQFQRKATKRTRQRERQERLRRVKLAVIAATKGALSPKRAMHFARVWVDRGQI